MTQDYFRGQIVRRSGIRKFHGYGVIKEALGNLRLIWWDTDTYSWEPICKIELTYQNGEWLIIDRIKRRNNDMDSR